ncbi:MAG: hypothetical protein KY475_02285 [Planctomycetes bacterium]|nr:hypothetical protein [Planctomycetota bacterium]
MKRWIFLDPLNPQEAAYRAEMLRRINAWWSEFSGKTDEIDNLFHGQADWDLAEWMQQHLQAIDESLMWEFGPAVRGEGHRLVITPEAQRYLRPLTGAVLSKAPHIDGWEFYGYRLPESEEMALQSVEGRTGGDIAGAMVQAEIGESGRVDLLFCLPHCTDPDNEEQLSHAFIGAESLLGEQVLDQWIGVIEIEPLSKGGLLSKLRRKRQKADPAKLVALGQLRSRVESLVSQLVEQLPAAPCHAFVQDAAWTGYELQSVEADDYPRREDLLVAITARPDVFEASGGGAAFFSACYSRCDEKFCYVKLDRSDADDGEKYLDRAPLEDAINERLASAKLGCVIGGGTGVRYSYSDLALTDLQRGVAAVRETLRERNVPLRTWIRFFDDELAAEWVGIHGDAPPPPE